MMPDQQSTPFWGTYFDRDAVLRLERRVRILGWVLFGMYLAQYLYDTVTLLYNNLSNGYPPDWAYLVLGLSRPAQGLMLLVVLYVLSSALLILLDIEHNTRCAARALKRSK